MISSTEEAARGSNAAATPMTKKLSVNVLRMKNVDVDVITGGTSLLSAMTTAMITAMNTVKTATIKTVNTKVIWTTCGPMNIMNTATKENVIV